jgi:hypothetical protein
LIIVRHPENGTRRAELVAATIPKLRPPPAEQRASPQKARSTAARPAAGPPAAALGIRVLPDANDGYAIRDAPTLGPARLLYRHEARGRCERECLRYGRNSIGDNSDVQTFLRHGSCSCYVLRLCGSVALCAMAPRTAALRTFRPAPRTRLGTASHRAGPAAFVRTAQESPADRTTPAAPARPNPRP